ncbi:Protein TCP17 [Durusdinium trenchii]
MLRSALKCGRVEQRLMELGLAVPEAAAPAANYVPSVRSGNLLFISGQIPKQPDNSLLKGQLGASYSLEEGKAAARLCGLHLVGQMKAACGDLDKVLNRKTRAL